MAGGTISDENFTNYRYFHFTFPVGGFVWRWDYIHPDDVRRSPRFQRERAAYTPDLHFLLPHYSKKADENKPTSTGALAGNEFVSIPIAGECICDWLQFIEGLRNKRGNGWLMGAAVLSAS
jgi:hypothetical protein